MARSEISAISAVSSPSAGTQGAFKGALGQSESRHEAGVSAVCGIVQTQNAPLFGGAL